MRVLIDGFWWSHGPPSNRMVLHEMTRTWAERHPGDELVVATPRPRPGTAPPSQLGPSVSEARTLLRLHPAVNAVEMPVIARRVDADVVLAHNFAVPRRASAVYLYDVIFQTHPEWFTWTERRYFSLMPRAARRAAVVFTATHAERRRILAHNPGLAPVVVTGLAPPEALSDRPTAAPTLGLTPGRFVLTVGRLNARKNLARTAEAALLSGAVSPDCPLVVVGGRSGKAPEGGERIAAAEAAGLVVSAEGVTTAELAWLYRHCRAFVYLSLAEGYGLPPVEASTLGAPVVVSDLEVFRETLGPSATFVDPTDVPAAASAIGEVIAHPTPRPPARPPTWAAIVDVIRERLHELVDAPTGTWTSPAPAALASASPAGSRR